MAAQRIMVMTHDKLSLSQQIRKEHLRQSRAPLSWVTTYLFVYKFFNGHQVVLYPAKSYTCQSCLFPGWYCLYRVNIIILPTVHRGQCVLFASREHLPQPEHIQYSVQVSQLYSCLVFVFVPGIKAFSPRMRTTSVSALDEFFNSRQKRQRQREDGRCSSLPIS